VAEARLDFAASALRVRLEEGFGGDIGESVKAAVRRCESGAAVIDGDAPARPDSAGREAAPGEDGRRGFVRIAAGAAIFAAGLLLARFAPGAPHFSLAALALSYLVLGGDVIAEAAKSSLASATPASARMSRSIFAAQSGQSTPRSLKDLFMAVFRFGGCSGIYG
jgi:hypothetical protein